MNKKQTTIETPDGSAIYYEVSGKGFPLFLLHGNGGDTNYFKEQVPEFSKFYKVFNIDSRGHGQSVNTSHSLTFSQMVEDLYLVMKKEKIKQANIIGFSDGANLAMMFTKKYPSLVHRLILNAGNTFEKSVYWPFRLLTYLEYLFFFLLGLLNKKAKQKALVIHLMFGDLNISKKDLNQLSCKTLIIVGKYDLIKRSHSIYLAKQIPNASLVVVDKQGHSFAKKAPNIFNKEVLKFLNNK